MDRRVIVGVIGGASLVAVALGASLGWYANDSLGGGGETVLMSTAPIIDAPADALPPPVALATTANPNDAPPPTSDVPPPAYVGEVGNRLVLPTIVIHGSAPKTRKRLHTPAKTSHFFDFHHAKNCDRVESVAGSVTRCG